MSYRGSGDGRMDDEDYNDYSGSGSGMGQFDTYKSGRYRK